MIRLACIGLGEESLRQLAPRLRGAELLSAEGPALPEACDAAAFLGPAGGDAARMDAFLSAGKPVLVSTDHLCSRAAFDRAFAAGRGARLMIANPDRFLPSRRLVRRELAEKLGEPGLVRSHRWYSQGAETADVALLRELDVALWLFAQAPNVVYAVEQTAGAGRLVGLLVHLGFPQGGMALLEQAALPPGDGYRSLSVIGSAGAAYADDHQNLQLLYRGGPPQAVGPDEAVTALAALVRQFVDALASNIEGPASLAEWGAVLNVADAVQESLTARRAVATGGLDDPGQSLPLVGRGKPEVQGREAVPAARGASEADGNRCAACDRVDDP
jgi:hypothetical protein